MLTAMRHLELITDDTADRVDEEQFWANVTGGEPGGDQGESS